LTLAAVAIADRDAMGEVAGGNLAESRIDLADRSDQSQRDRAAEDQREDDGAQRKGNDDCLRGAVGLAARLDARHHVGLGLVDQLVSQPLEPVGQRPRLFQLRLARLVDVPAADQLDDPRHDGDEPIVLFPHLAEQLDLVLGDELEPLEVVAELVQLAQRAVQCALIRNQQRRGDAVELARGVVLHLAIGRDLAFALDQFFGALVDGTQLVEPGGSECDQECRDREKRHQQL
jgi:hypothetical protein